MKRLTIAVLAGLCAAPALAEPLHIDVSAKAEDKSQFVPTGANGGVLNFLFDFQPMESRIDGDPLAGAAGSCFGLGKSNNGLTLGEGYCAFTDPAGENLVMHWYMEPAAEVHGSWQFVGGSGKWAAAAGGGFFYDTPDTRGGAPATTFAGQVSFE